MKTTIYTCAKCEFENSDFSTWGHHYYKIDTHFITINRDIAICYSCKSIVSAEILPFENEINNLEIEKSVSKAELEAIKLALSSRKTGPRCLNCGSHDFEFIPNFKISKEQVRYRLPVRTGLFHRNCGGRIYADTDTPKFFMGDRLPKRYYNKDGIEIKSPINFK
ncbi:hypothetical protein ACKGJO_00970 [Gracilimonas sp. Q87]|uniref:hypothetical protein n=1 Tax=Gracilimonas sp. Q87 TaxID=3384766 RepID=UPI00398421F0